MRTIALVGRSGTGKSHKAQMVSKECGADLIIDDGLLISGYQVVAGISAKKEKTRLSATRRALFQDPLHAKQVYDKIREFNPQSILVLGTSEAMIAAICKALHIPLPEEKIFIEDISSDKDIKIAQHVRNFDGKHVIPVPTLEIKKDFSGYLLDPLKIFYRKGKYVEEKSVVRPTYSYLGKYTISDTTISQIVQYAAQMVPGISPGGRVIVENHPGGVDLNIEVVVEYGVPIRQLLEKVQSDVSKQVEYMTALNVLRVNVTAKKFSFKEVET
ncbi:MAG: Asp23/Gls24 family envelope stress response protein [Thermoanaerobacterales bacterium]|nr:Asp23/Gls24 family envelope stress response protein [Thermoanaerobacterales bacterium]